MRTVLLLLAILPIGNAIAQGTINFANLVISGGGRVVDAPVRCGSLVSGPDFQARLYARPAGNSGAFEGVGEPAPFLTGIVAGYWLPVARTYDGVPPGGSAEIVVRVWNINSGATWEQATFRGETSPITVVTGGGGSPPAHPALLVGLQGMDMCIPEPKSIAIGALALVIMVVPWLRRDK